MNHKLESGPQGETSITSYMQMTPLSWQKAKRIWLKTQQSKKEDMASDAITSWQIDRGTTEQWEILFWGDPKITADSDCSHEIKRHLPLGRKAMTNLDSILKSRDITLPTKAHLVKPIVFPVVTYGCESWARKRLSTEELMPSDCGAGKYSWESTGL